MGFLRFWLALCVIRQHVAESSMPLHLFMPAGPVAVQCFYVISGFYMALVLDRKYVRSPWVFYFNRVMRLYPAFVVLSLLAIGVAWWDRWTWGYTNGLYGGFESAWPHLGLGARAITVVTNLFIEGKDVTSFLAVDPRTAQYYFTAHWKQQAFPGVNLQVLPQAWSLGLEFSFYLLSPWLLRLRSRWLLALVALSLALRVLLSLCGLDQDPWNYRFFPSELALFLGGALAYRIYQRLPETDTGWRRASYLATCAFIPALVFGPVFAGGDGPLAMVLVPLLSLALPWIFDRTKDLA